MLKTSTKNNLKSKKTFSIFSVFYLFSKILPKKKEIKSSPNYNEMLNNFEIKIKKN